LDQGFVENLANREAAVANLGALPHARAASHDEVMRLIGDWRFWGRGLDKSLGRAVVDGLMS
jgi:hypothetical protein